MNMEEFLEDYENAHRGSGTWPISLRFLARQNGVLFPCPTHKIFEKYLEPRGWTKKSATISNPHSYVFPPKEEEKDAEMERDT